MSVIFISEETPATQFALGHSTTTWQCGDCNWAVWIQLHAAFPRPKLKEVDETKINKIEWVKNLGVKKVVSCTQNKNNKKETEKH